MRWIVLMLLLAPAAVASTGKASAGGRPDALPLGDPERRDKTAPVELDTLFDTRASQALVPSQLAERLREVRLLLIGESHTSEEFHRVQEMIIRELHRAGRKVVVGLEMMPTEAQGALDRWTAGELSEEAFLEQAEWYENWGYHWEYYRPIFQLARRQAIAMRGLNVPRKLVRAAREQGFDGLEEADRRRLPPEIQPPTDEFRRLFLSYFDEDSGHRPEGDMLEGFLRSQIAWDASMGFAAAEVLKDDPEALVVVLVGSGHVAYGLGIARQVASLVDGGIATLIPVPVTLDGEPREGVSASYADFLWGVAEEPWPRFPSLGLSTRAGEAGAREVLFVTEESAAEDAGVEVGDLLLSIDGHDVDGARIVRQVMGSKHWGDTVELRWRRGEEEMAATAYLRRTQ